jgi:hypothetical protein
VSRFCPDAAAVTSKSVTIARLKKILCFIGKVKVIAK